MQFDQLKRRDFITLLGGAVAWPFAARAQQPRPMRRIGVLTSSNESDPEAQASMAAFRGELGRLGWTEGRNIAIEYQWAEGRTERFAEISSEFVRLKVDVIVTYGTAAIAAAKRATNIIPIVFAGAAARHRRAAFEAADYLMDRLKTEAVFWKREVGEATCSRLQKTPRGFSRP